VRRTINIKFDLDGVLVDFEGCVRKMLAGLGFEVVSNEWRIKTKPMIPDAELLNIFDIVYSEPEHIDIIDGATQLINRLYEITGCPVEIVTARPVKTAASTHALVERITDRPFTIAYKNGHSKLHYLKTVDYFVEDKPSTVIELANAGKKVFMPVWPWNKHVESGRYGRGKVIQIKGVADLVSTANMLVKRGD
jgi:hypothetical protein